MQQEITHRYQANLASSRGYEALFASLMTFPTVPREESWDKEHVSINFMTTILRYRSTNVLLVLFAVDQPPTTGAQATTTPLFPVPADLGSHNTKAQRKQQPAQALSYQLHAWTQVPTSIVTPSARNMKSWGMLLLIAQRLSFIWRFSLVGNFLQVS